MKMSWFRVKWSGSPMNRGLPADSTRVYIRISAVRSWSAQAMLQGFAVETGGLP